MTTTKAVPVTETGRNIYDEVVNHCREFGYPPPHIPMRIVREVFDGLKKTDRDLEEMLSSFRD